MFQKFSSMNSEDNGMDSFVLHRFYSERIITYEATDELYLCFKPQGTVMLLERSLTTARTLLQYA